MGRRGCSRVGHLREHVQGSASSPPQFNPDAQQAEPEAEESHCDPPVRLMGLSGAGPGWNEAGTLMSHDREERSGMHPRQSELPRPGSQFIRRLVRLTMSGGRSVEGNVHVTDGQSLGVFLTTRRYMTSLTEARWLDPQGTVLPHLALRTEKVVFAASLDEGLPVATNARPTPNPRWAEFTLDDGTVMHVGLHIAEEQRMTDYFDSAPAFLPVVQASVVGSERLLGPISVNTSKIVALREIEPRGSAE